MDLKTGRKKTHGRQYGCGSVLTCASLFQVLFWEKGSRQSEAERVRITNTTALLTGLKGSTVYLISVRAQNSAGLGPCSPALNVTTKKPRESAIVLQHAHRFTCTDFQKQSVACQYREEELCQFVIFLFLFPFFIFKMIHAN